MPLLPSPSRRRTDAKTIASNCTAPSRQNARARETRRHRHGHGWRAIVNERQPTPRLTAFWSTMEVCQKEGCRRRGGRQPGPRRQRPVSPCEEAYVAPLSHNPRRRRRADDPLRRRHDAAGKRPGARRKGPPCAGPRRRGHRPARRLLHADGVLRPAHRVLHGAVRPGRRLPEGPRAAGRAQRQGHRDPGVLRRRPRARPARRGAACRFERRSGGGPARGTRLHGVHAGVPPRVRLSLGT